MAIIGVHALVYAKRANEVRQLFGDVLGWRSVDAGDGWLIFATPPAELAVHPAESGGSHQLYLMCDDIEATVADLEKKGVATVGGINDRGWGLVTSLKLPGGEELGLYEPRHPLAIERTTARKPARTKKAAKAKRPVRKRPRARGAR